MYSNNNIFPSSKFATGGIMMKERTTVEDTLPESEWQHRYAHALLIPLSLYRLWTDEEKKTLEDLVTIEFGNKENLNKNEAVFGLELQEKIDPPMWMYVLKGIRNIKKKK